MIPKQRWMVMPEGHGDGAVESPHEIVGEMTNETEKPRLLFIGGTPRGRRVLDLLLGRNLIPVGAFVLSEDKHEALRSSLEIERLALERGFPVKITKRLSAADVSTICQVYRPDLIVMVGWRTIVPAAVYEFPRLGCVSVHDSPLPRYRGFAPVNWAVINGEREWGVTLMHVSAGIDEGDIIGQDCFSVPDRTTAPQLYELIMDATLRVIDRHLAGLLAGTAPRRAQDHSRATFACARTPDDGQIDWNASVQRIDRLIRGLTYPYPGAWTLWKGERIVIWEAEPVTPPPLYEGRLRGRVVGFTDATADVLTRDGVLRLQSVQLEGDNRPRPAGEVIRSVKTSLGAPARAAAE